MRKRTVFWVVLAVSAMLATAQPATLSAGELAWGNLAGLLHRTPVDISCPQSQDQCHHEGCVTRVPVQDCVKGKKEVFCCKVRCEYVAVPVTKYRWVTRCVKKEIPCPYCMPTCEEREVDHCYEAEHWEKYPNGCGDLHSKTCQAKSEKLPCKHCGRKPGETVVKVHYRSCVKEPYTVYRQVKKPVCVKYPCHEHVEVPITRYVCNNCGGCDDPCGDPGCCEPSCE